MLRGDIMEESDEPGEYEIQENFTIRGDTDTLDSLRETDKGRQALDHIAEQFDTSWDGSTDRTDFEQDTVILRNDLKNAVERDFSGDEHLVGYEKYESKDVLNGALSEYTDDDTLFVYASQLEDVATENQMPENSTFTDFADDNDLVAYAQENDALIISTSNTFNEEYSNDIAILPPSAALAGYKMKAADEEGYDSLIAASEDIF